MPGSAFWRGLTWVVVHMQPHAPENKGKGDELPMCASQTPACAMAQHRERVRCLNLMHRKWNAECTYKIGKKHTSLMLGYENTLGTAWANSRRPQHSSKRELMNLSAHGESHTDNSNTHFTSHRRPRKLTTVLTISAKCFLNIFYNLYLQHKSPILYS